MEHFSETSLRNNDDQLDVLEEGSVSDVDTGTDAYSDTEKEPVFHNFVRPSYDFVFDEADGAGDRDGSFVKNIDLRRLLELDLSRNFSVELVDSKLCMRPPCIIDDDRARGAV